MAVPPAFIFSSRRVARASSVRDRFQIQYNKGIERASTDAAYLAVSQPSWLLLRSVYDRYTKYPISYQTYTTYFQTLQVIKRPSSGQGYTTIPHLHCLASIIFHFMQLFELSVCVAHLCVLSLRSYSFFILFCLDSFLTLRCSRVMLQVVLYLENLIPCTCLLSCPWKQLHGLLVFTLSAAIQWHFRHSGTHFSLIRRWFSSTCYCRFSSSLAFLLSSLVGLLPSVFMCLGTVRSGCWLLLMMMNVNLFRRLRFAIVVLLFPCR